MRNIKFAVMFAALLSVLSFSSCLNDSNNDGYDAFAEVTLKSDGLGAYYFITDGGVTFIPENISVLSSILLKDGTYLKRFVGGFKLSTGEVYSPDKKSFKISSVAVSSSLIYQPMTTRPDTISGNYGIADVNSKLWAAYGYLNVPFTYYYSATSKINAYQFNVFATDAKVDTLYLTMKQSRNIENGEYYVTTPQVISYSLPFDKAEFINLYRNLQPKNDTIVIKLSAKVYGKDAPVIRTTKYKASQR